MYSNFGQFINGQWQQAEKNETYKVINPATEEVLGEASKASSVDVQKSIKISRERTRNMEKYHTMAKVLCNKKNCRFDA